jgi:hypothetical protein
VVLEKEASFEVYRWPGLGQKLHHHIPAQNKDGALFSYPLVEPEDPLQPEWALGGWKCLHNVLKRGN